MILNPNSRSVNFSVVNLKGFTNFKTEGRGRNFSLKNIINYADEKQGYEHGGKDYGRSTQFTKKNRIMKRELKHNWQSTYLIQNHQYSPSQLCHEPSHQPENAVL